MNPLSLPAVPDLLPVAAVALAVLAGVFVWQRCDFVIRVRGGRVECRGRVPLALTRGIQEFLLQDLGLRQPVTIRGRWQGKRLRVWCSGGLTRGQEQRVRNF